MEVYSVERLNNSPEPPATDAVPAEEAVDTQDEVECEFNQEFQHKFAFHSIYILQYTTFAEGFVLTEYGIIFDTPPTVLAQSLSKIILPVGGYYLERT